jgi:hypothetical protein
MVAPTWPESPSPSPVFNVTGLYLTEKTVGVAVWSLDGEGSDQGRALGILQPSELLSTYYVSGPVLGTRIH